MWSVVVLNAFQLSRSYCIFSMKLTAEVLRSMKVSKVFREHKEKVNCIDYSFNGELMISSSNDDSIFVYCCLEGK